MKEENLSDWEKLRVKYFEETCLLIFSDLMVSLDFSEYYF